MRPKDRRDGGQSDLFKVRLDQIVDLNHPLVKLGRSIDWRFLESRFGAAYDDDPGRPPLPTRLMAGLAILKSAHNLSDEALCDRWIENPYYQLFCGEEFFVHTLPFERSSLTRWRQRMGEDKLNALLQESLATATRTGAAKPSDFTKAIVDTTVQSKVVAYPTDAPPTHRFRIYTSGQKRGVTLAIKRDLRRRAAVEPVIGHLKHDHRMAATTAPAPSAMPRTPSSPPSATTSNGSSPGSRLCVPFSGLPSPQPARQTGSVRPLEPLSSRTTKYPAPSHATSQLSRDHPFSEDDWGD